MGKCFVVMKFGQLDKDIKRSNGTFNELIKPALQAAGIVDDPEKDIIRADFESAKGGNLDEHCFSNIASADIVIADITEASPNVMYELGVRHALKRRGTVIIQEENNIIPFDLSKTYIHSYKYDIDYMEAERKKLAEFILKRIENDLDSPIHQWINLQSDLCNVNIDSSNKSNSNFEKRLEEEKRKYAELKMEYINLEKKAKEVMSIEGVKNIGNSLSFHNADRKQKYSGSRILSILNEQCTKNASSNNEEEFLNTLNLLTENNEYVDERHFIEISQLCGDMKLNAHRVDIMEYANNKYPKHEGIKIELIKAYNSSSSKKDKDSALKTIFEYFLLENENDDEDKPVFTEKSKKVTQYTDNILITIFNVFVNRYEYKKLLNITKSVEDVLSIKNYSVIRYKALALKNLNRNSEAVEYYHQIIKNYPTVYDLSRSASAFYEINEFELGYKLSELCVILDYDLAYRYIDLAQDIYRFNYGRKNTNEISIYQSERAAELAIIPLLFKAITIEPKKEFVDVVIRFLTRRTNRSREIKILNEAEDYHYGTITKLLEGGREIYDWSIVNYIEKHGTDDFNVVSALDEIIELIHKNVSIER